jgi:hypothetical protein
VSRKTTISCHPRVEGLARFSSNARQPRQAAAQLRRPEVLVLAHVTNCSISNSCSRRRAVITAQGSPFETSAD